MERFQFEWIKVIIQLRFFEKRKSYIFPRPHFPFTMARTACVTVLFLASLALSAALGPAKTCSTGVAEEDPTAV